MKLTQLVVLAIFGALSATPAFASTLGLTPSETGGYGYAYYEYGFSFRVNTPINVTALATYKNDGAVLQVGHLVSLWSASGDNTPLATATVTPADPAVTVPYSPHPHFYYYHDITPLLLAPGDYVVGGSPAIEDFFFQSNGVLSAPEITFLEGRYGYVVDGRPEGTFTLPAFGGNFLFTAADEVGPNGVPEPSSVVLLTIGAGLATTAVIRNRINRHR